MNVVVILALLVLLVCAVLTVVAGFLTNILDGSSDRDVIPTPERPQTVITLVHGTWARRARWTRPDSRLCRALREGLPHLLFERFIWSGSNSITSRESAARGLAEHLRRLVSRFPTANHYVIAHSHGGNIAMYALREDDLRDRVGVVCLSTPFLHVRPRVVPRVSRLALAGAAIMLPMFVREAAEKQFWPTGPAILEWVSGVIALAVGIGLVIAVPRAARRISGRLAFPRVSPSRCLLVRVAGDEASAALGSLQLINWLTTVLWVKPVELLQAGYDRLGEWSKAVERFDRAALWACVASMVLLTIGGSVGYARGFVLIWAAGLAGAVLLVYWMIRWMRYNFLLYGFIFLGIVFAPLPLLLGLLLLPFGPRLAPFAVLLDVSAEPTPPGTWTVCQLPTQPADEPIPMMHSASYQLPEAIALILAWLQKGPPSTLVA